MKFQFVYERYVLSTVLPCRPQSETLTHANYTILAILLTDKECAKSPAIQTGWLSIAVRRLSHRDCCDAGSQRPTSIRKVGNLDVLSAQGNKGIQS